MRTSTDKFNLVEALEEFPQSGRVIPEINNAHCREIIYGAYRIMYRITEKEIWITGVLHGAKNWRPE